MQVMTTFVTNDGKKFKTEEEAHAHEVSSKYLSDIKGMLEANGLMIVTTTPKGGVVKRYKGLKKTVALIAAWEMYKKSRDEQPSDEGEQPTV